MAITVQDVLNAPVWTVYHHQSAGSNKVWAYFNLPGVPKRHVVAYGPYGEGECEIRGGIVQQVNGDGGSKANEKVRKGKYNPLGARTAAMLGVQDKFKSWLEGLSQAQLDNYFGFLAQTAANRAVPGVVDPSIKSWLKVSPAPAAEEESRPWAF